MPINYSPAQEARGLTAGIEKGKDKKVGEDGDLSSEEEDAEEDEVKEEDSNLREKIVSILVRKG